MKIMQINSVYNEGSTGKIVHDLHTELKENGIESVVCYGRGKKVKEQGVYKICGEFYGKLNALRVRLTGLMYGGCFVSTNRLIRIIQKERPDIVHLHCLNGNFVNIYRLIWFLKKKQIKTVLTLHAEFMYTANCGYALDCEKWKEGCGKCPRLKKETHSWFFDGTKRSWKKMNAAFDGFDKEKLYIVAVSDWIKNRAKESLILKNFDIQTIHNGIDVSAFSKKSDDLTAIKEKYCIPNDKKIILQVTPDFNNSVKGGQYFLQLMNMLPDSYMGVVVGKNAPNTKRIIGIPFVSDKTELADIYTLADVFVITSICDNYPTVCLEANCCGTPVIGFDVGGVKETIYEQMGEVVKPFDIDLMKKKIEYWSTQNKKNIAEDIYKKNISTRMVNDYIRIYNNSNYV